MFSGFRCGAIRCRSAAPSGSRRSLRVTISAPFELIGVCRPSLWGPARLLLAWFGIFGIGPALALALWRRIVSPPPRDGATASPDEVIVFRFCIVYGAHQHSDDSPARRQCRPPGRVRVAFLLCRLALVPLRVLRPPRSPRGRDSFCFTCSPAGWPGLASASRPPAFCSPLWPFWL